MNSTRSATAELVFAPAERDVYSYEGIPNGLAPSGAKPDSRTLAMKWRLRSSGALRVKRGRKAINISPLWGEAPTIND